MYVCMYVYIAGNNNTPDKWELKYQIKHQKHINNETDIVTTITKN